MRLTFDRPLFSVKRLCFLLAAPLMFSTACSHVLVFDDGRYHVRVSPLTTQAHVFEQISSEGGMFLLDTAVVPYEIRGGWKAVWGADIPGIPSVAYNNVMATAFARPTVP